MAETIKNKDIARLKTGLLCNGIRVNPNASYFRDIVPAGYPEGGKSRAGIAGSGKSFILENGEPCNIGVLQPFLEGSPYEFAIMDGEGWILENGKKTIRATIVEPNWHSSPLFDTIQLHGRGSLATAISNFCAYKERGEGCKYCIINVGAERVTRRAEDIAAAIREIETMPALREYCRFEDRHNPELVEQRREVVRPEDININSGTLKNAARVYEDVTSSIREVSDLPIGIQICPLNEGEMESIHSAGVDEISFNLEVYDRSARREVIPGKDGDNPLESYLKAMDAAVGVFGENQVESWILIGLEPAEKTIEGIKAIAETGAIPLPKPFRPLYGTEYERKRPPSVEEAVTIYEAWLDTIKDCGLDPLKTRAGCGRCNGCFPLHELLKHGI